jgi:hypothetical protein
MFHIREEKLFEVLKNAHKLEIEKGQKFSPADLETMFGTHKKIKDTEKINEYSIFANPGLYFIIKTSGKNPIITIVINEPYEKNLYYYRYQDLSYKIEKGKLNKQEWGEPQLEKLLDDFNIELKKGFTEEEAEEYSAKAWRVHIYDDIYYAPLIGPGSENVAAFIEDFRRSYDDIKEKMNFEDRPYQWPKRDLLTAVVSYDVYLYSRPVVQTPTFNSRDYLEYIRDEHTINKQPSIE